MTTNIIDGNVIDASNPLETHPTSSYTTQITVTPTLTVAAGYANGDYVGTSGVAMIFANAARAAGGTGRVIALQLIDKVSASVACELWLFDSAVTPPADSAAWVVSDADLAHLVAVVPISTYYAETGGTVGQNVITYPFACAAGSTSLYGCLVTRGAPGYNANVVTLKLGILQD